MRTFKAHLKEKLKNKNFKEIYDEEKKLIDLSLQIYEIREDAGLSQHEVAENAHITQQQLSKIESGINSELSTMEILEI